MDSAKDLSTSFSTMRNLAMGSVLALLLVALASGYLVYRAYENSGKRVYVVSQSGSVAALSAGTDAHLVVFTHCQTLRSWIDWNTPQLTRNQSQ